MASAGAQPLLIALIAAVGTGLPTLAYTIWRGRKLGPKEEDAIVTRTAHDAVEAMDTVLTAARREREEMQDKLDAALRKIAELERCRAEDAEHIETLERRVEYLEGEVETLKAS